MTDFNIVAVDPMTGAEEWQTYTASTLSEALMLAKRADAGRRDRTYGIQPDDYKVADAEGIAFNVADGLLV